MLELEGMLEDRFLLQVLLSCLGKFSFYFPCWSERGNLPSQHLFILLNAKTIKKEAFFKKKLKLLATNHMSISRHLKMRMSCQLLKRKWYLSGEMLQTKTDIFLTFAAAQLERNSWSWLHGPWSSGMTVSLLSSDRMKI